MNAVKTIAKRELATIFTTPLAYIFLIAFVVLANSATFFMGYFFENGQATLLTFFQFHPWLYLFFIPAISMRSWAEEHQTGTLEVLRTLPVKPNQLVLGKFLALWLFVGIALICTMTLWLTVNYLGQPDNGVILVGYIGSWLMAGGFLAIGCYASSLTQNQVIAFVLAACISFLFVFSGTSLIQGVLAGLSDTMNQALQNISILNHFTSFQQGIIGLSSVLYFLALISFFLYANTKNITATRVH